MSRPTTTPPLDPAGDIPERLYFKIGEAAQLVGVQAHVLRYWEKEIPGVRPLKSPTNQRRYRRRDVEIFREVRRLLHEERYTLAGVRKRLAGSKAKTLGNEGEGERSGEDTGRSHVASQSNNNASRSSAKSSEPREQSVGTGKGSDPQPVSDDALQRVRNGLRELVRLAGEEP